MARKAGISLRTIAEATGFSLVTVSRALNRDFLVDPETAKRVQKEADRLGYKLPPKERRSTRVHRGNTDEKPLRLGRLAFIIPDLSTHGFETPLSKALLKGISEYLFQKKIELVSTHLDQGEELPEVIAKKEVDGYILRGNFDKIPLAKRQLIQMGRFPHVSIFGLPPVDHPELTTQLEDYILPDDRLIGRIALNTLVKKGVDTPLLISTLPDQHLPLAQASTFSRQNGFINEAFTQGSAYRSLEISTNNKAKIIQKIERYIQKYGRPKGIFLTRGFPELLDALDDLGLTTKQKTQLYCVVAGEKDPILKQHVHAIDLRPEAMGKAAAELLLWRINNPGLEAKSILVRPQLLCAKPKR